MLPKKIPYSGSIAQYHYVNALIAAVIVLMLLSVKFNWFAIRCIYAQNGGSCTTCGLTTAFHSLLNGQYTNTRPDFMALVILFAGQLVIRPLVSVLLISTQRFTLIRNSDVVVNAGLFIAFLVL